MVWEWGFTGRFWIGLAGWLGNFHYFLGNPGIKVSQVANGLERWPEFYTGA